MQTTPVLGAAALPDWGVIRARGADARAFLNGQLTQDVASLAPGQARLAGYCSAKGRLLATFVVWCGRDDEILLACSADLLQPTLKRLSMFVLRAKCRLDDASAEYPLVGAVGAAAAEMLGADLPAAVWDQSRHADCDIVRLPPADGMPRFLRASRDPSHALPELDAAAWRWLEVRSGVVRIVAATVEQFVPQMVNLDAAGGVSFSKGCYPGQEVVARSQYRGTLKRRALLFEVDGVAAAGQEIVSAADPGQPAGMVALAAPRGGRSALLAEVKLALADAPLHLGGIDGPPLAPRELPYALPAQD